jgi:hypothetical protein
MEISDPAAVRITLISEKQPVCQPAKLPAQNRVPIRKQRYTRLNPADRSQKFQPPD